jgi:hypothetical protein
MENEKIGDYAFLAGIVIAVIASLVPGVVAASTVSLALVVLGLVVGLLNIKEKETQAFLVAAIAFLVTANAEPGFAAIPQIGSQYLVPILRNLAVFVAPAAIIVAVKAIWNLGRNE